MLLPTKDVLQRKRLDLNNIDGHKGRPDEADAEDYNDNLWHQWANVTAQTNNETCMYVYTTPCATQSLCDTENKFTNKNNLYPRIV